MSEHPAPRPVADATPDSRVSARFLPGDGGSRRARGGGLLRKSGRSFWWVNLARLAILVGFLGLWEFGAKNGKIDRFFFPAPSTIWDWLVTTTKSGDLVHNTTSTLIAMVYGFVIGSLAGIVVGLLFARFRPLELIFSPFLTTLNALPRVALAPLFVIYFGIGMTSKVAVSVSIVFFVLFYNTRAGVRGADPDLMTLGRVLGNPPRTIYRKILIPAALAPIFAGLKLAVVYALLGVIVSEMVASESGLGQVIQLSANSANMAGVYGALLVLALLALALSFVTGLVEKWALRWDTESR